MHGRILRHKAARSARRRERNSGRLRRSGILPRDGLGFHEAGELAIDRAKHRAEIRREIAALFLDSAGLGDPRRA